MAIPASIRVKLSSEDAGALTLTPVVAQELPFAELLDRIVETAGKDLDRVLRILEAGTMSSGGTRYRWQGLAPHRAELAPALAEFPDADPDRPFEARLAVKAVFQEPLGARLEMPQQAAGARRFLRRRSFWDALVAILAAEEALYVEYSYKEKADRYRIRLSRTAAAAIRAQAGMLAYRGLAQRVKMSTFDAVDVYVPRASAVRFQGDSS
ncbi:MAG: hypothetical protein KIT09_11450 [Bryobacteraceae bacterium]|nr:hypothetical protein [Bryobacteraceae bacterium]